jgi:pimeloyl-ACP methyl ester carboxylesterase
MKILVKVLLNLLRVVLVLFIVLFSLATLFGGSYLQTMVLLLMAAAIIWWPPFLKNRWGKSASLLARVIFIILLFTSNFIFFRQDPKSSIYLSENHRERLMQVYDQQLESWPANTESFFINSRYGDVHVLACGSRENPPLVMVHAASMGAHSWAENLDPLIDHYRIYAVDNIGEGNKSQLTDVLIYPGNQKEIADHFAEIMDELGIQSSPLFGASNGGYIVQSFAYHYPDRVESLSLFGPMGLTKLTGRSIIMLSIASMYPVQLIRNWVTGWALGEDDYVRGAYGEWFECILQGTIPSVGQPVPMTTAQKKVMKMPVLLFLGTNDPIVGNAFDAKKSGEEYPNIRIEILEAGHLIAVEKARRVNEVVAEFLGI